MDIDKTKITKGEARYDDSPPRISGCEWERIVIGDTPVYECYNSTGDDDALVCDAFNTFTATGLTPSELAEIYTIAKTLLKGDWRWEASLANKATETQQ